MSRRDLENGPITPGKRDKGGRNESPSKVLTRPPPPQTYDTARVTMHRILKTALAAQTERKKR